MTFNFATGFYFLSDKKYAVFFVFSVSLQFSELKFMRIFLSLKLIATFLQIKLRCEEMKEKGVPKDPCYSIRLRF